MASNFGAQVKEAGKVDMELAAQQQQLMSSLGTLLSEQAASQDSIKLGGGLVTPELLRLQNAETLKTEARVQGLAAKAGFSPDLSIDIQAILLDDIKSNALKLRDTAAQLQADKSVSLFENPIQAVINAFTIPWDEQELEGLTSQRDQLYKSYSDITSGVTNAAASARAIQAKTTEAIALEEQKAVESELSRQRKLGEAAVLRHNIDGVSMAMNANKTQLDRMQAYDMWQNREENNALLREQRRSVIDERAAKEKLRLTQEEAEVRMLSLANLALKEAGKPTFQSLGEVKSRLLTNKDKQVFDELVERGRVLEDPALKHTYRYGNTPQETIAFIDSIGMQGATPAQKKLIDIVRVANAEAAKGVKDKVSGQPVSAEKLVRAAVETLEIVKRGDENNPLQALTFGTLLDQADVKSQVAYPILQAAVTEGNKNVSAHPELVVPVLAKAVNERKISPDDAARLLNSMYLSSAKVNGENNKMSQITGLKQTRFVTDITGIDLKQSTEAAAFITPIVAGLTATGVGIPAATVALGLGAAGTAYLGAADRRELRGIDFIDFNQARNIMVRASAAGRITLNTRSVYPEGHRGFYPPTTIQGNQ